MTRTPVVETPGDRRALARDAGVGTISIASVLAGTLVAFGAFAILVAIAAAIASAAGVDTDLTTNDWREAGVAGGVILAVVLFLSYFYGGYTAGRMARRNGLMQGVLVFITAILAVAIVAAATRILTDIDTDRILDNLRSIGVPTTRDEWSDVGTVAGLLSLIAMLAGAVLGGSYGERWHNRLLARALDPDVGPEGEVRRRVAEDEGQAEVRHDEAAERVDRSTAGHTTAGTTVRDRERDAGDTGNTGNTGDAGDATDATDARRGAADDPAVRRDLDNL